MKRKKFDWESIYKEIPFDNMGWYHPHLDPDLENFLNEYQIKEGTFLDIGTGAGNQAIELFRKGFTVVGTDVSKTAIAKAKNRFANFKLVKFIEDDILNTLRNS